MASQSKESRINLAIQAMQRDKNLSRRHTAKIYDIPESTLRDRVNGKTPKPESRPAAHRLTITEEEALVLYILDLDARGFAPQYAGVEDMANLLLAQRDARHVRKHWAERFVKRQPDLKTRFKSRIRLPESPLRKSRGYWRVV
jgi:hypothetical protein